MLSPKILKCADRPEVPIVKIKYNIRFYRPNSEFDSVLGIEEVYTSRKSTFQVLSY